VAAAWDRRPPSQALSLGRRAADAALANLDQSLLRLAPWAPIRRRERAGLRADAGRRLGVDE